MFLLYVLSVIFSIGSTWYMYNKYKNDGTLGFWLGARIVVMGMIPYLNLLMVFICLLTIVLYDES